MSNKHQGLKGYRLHDERIAYTGGDGSMRSVKYELVGDNQKKIFEAIKHDNLKLYGALNFKDYLQNKDEPNLLDFWLLALANGFIFSNKNSIQREFQSYLKLESSEEKLFNSLDDEIKNHLNKDEWMLFYSTTHRGLNKKTKEQRIKVIEKISLEDDVHPNIKNIFEQYVSKLDDESLNEQIIKNEMFNIHSTGLETEQQEKYEYLDNYSFAIDLNLEVTTITDRTKFLDAIIARRISEVGENLAKRWIGIGDNGNYFNGIFGSLFELLSDDKKTEQVAKEINQFYKLDKEAEILKRLKTIQSYANKIGKPLLTSRWSDYRSDFNGTIESWYSNRVEKQKTTLEQLFGQTFDKETRKIIELKKDSGESISVKKLIEKIVSALKEFNGLQEYKISNDTKLKPEEQEKKRDELVEQGQKIINFIGDDFHRTIDREFTEQLESYLSVWKSDLNEFDLMFATTTKGGNRSYPAGTSGYTEKNDSAAFPKGWQRNLSKHIQSSPVFFGENKRQLWKGILTLKIDVVEQSNVITQILNDNDETSLVQIDPKQIDRLADLFNRIKNDGNSEVANVLQKISEKLNLDFSKRDQKNRFFVSPFSRGKQNDLLENATLGNYTNKNLLEDSRLIELINKMSENPEKDFLLRDVTQLSKIVASAQLKLSSKEKQRELVFAHSKLQGYSSLISKQNVISRYPLQAINGSQNLLAVDVLQPEPPKRRKYFYVFNRLNFSEEISIATKKLIAPRDQKYEFDNQINGIELPFLEVRSSRYQIQFLDWFMGDYKKRKTRLLSGGSFTIGEEDVEINWSENKPTIQNYNERIFVSQPFTIETKSEQTTPAIEQTNFDKNKFIGVDIGEYGLAWTLIEVESDGLHVNALESGFIADNAQRTLKDDVKNKRDSQVRQTFTSPDTKIARVRETLIGSYVNQLAQLSMKHGAALAFESSVSAFETGSNKISKIYDSIKRPFIAMKDNDSQTKQAWGKLTNETFFNKGFQTTAAGTSQLSTAQNHPEETPRWTRMDITDSKEYELEEYQDGLFKIKLDSGRYVRAYFPKEKIGAKIKGSDLGHGVYQAMRPNMFVSDNKPFGGMEEVKRQLGIESFEELAKTFGPNKQRGNIGIYVSPYIDSLYIADADIQASFNIAVRGYLKSINPDRAKKDGENDLSAYFLTQAQEKLIFNEVGSLVAKYKKR